MPVISTVPVKATNITNSEWDILFWVCEMASKRNGDFVDLSDLEAVHTANPCLSETLSANVSQLIKHGLLRRRAGQNPDEVSHYVAPTTRGFELYATRHLATYDDLVRSVVEALINHHKDTDQSIADHTGQPLFLIQHILNSLEAAGHLQVTGSLRGPRHVFNIGPWCRVALAKP